MRIVIREAREDELDEAARVLAAAFEPLRPPVSSSYAARFDQYIAEVVNVRARILDAMVFVALDGKRILGTGTLYPPDATAAYARAVQCKPWPGDWASLRLLSVDPAERGRGIGRMLIEARLQRARELGATAAALHTAREFATARGLVERMGWERAPDYDHTPAPGVLAEAYVLPLRTIRSTVRHA